MDNDRFKSTSFDDEEDDLDRPGLLVLRLQATPLGCEWLLGQWAGLKAILDRDQPWLPSDKLKAVRLLGKQPFDAIDDRDVALVFLAAFVLKGASGQWCSEILTEMNGADIRRFVQNAADRQLGSLKPENATKAREVLLGIIERATERLTLKADAHRVRAEVQAELAADFLAFDDSPEGERLRRYELAHGRGVARALDLLQKHRRTAKPINQNDATGTIGESGISEQAPAMTAEITTNEPTVDCENVANEATDASDVGPDGPTYINAPTQNSSNEATDARENVTNEPSDANQKEGKDLNRSRIKIKSRIKNEDRRPTVDGENVTNEPTDACQNVTNEPTVPENNATNEPTDVCENMTNEPTRAADVGLESPTYMKESRDDENSILATLTNGRDDGHFRAEIDVEQASEWIRQEIEKRNANRADILRKMNEAIRMEADAVGAVHRARRARMRTKHAEFSQEAVGCRK